MTKISSHFATKMARKITDLSQVSNLEIIRVRRAREVKQSYFTSVGTTLVALADSIFLCSRTKPDLIISNGPGTAVPLVFANIILSKLMLRKTKTLFIESFCRVEHLSMSGRLLLPFVNQ